MAKSKLPLPPPCSTNTPESKPEPVREPTPSDSDYSSSDSEIEDEDGAELTPAMDAAILQTLTKIRNKDGTVYSGANVIGSALEAAQKTAAARGLGKVVKKKEDKVGGSGKWSVLSHD
jgi:protein KRI1